MVRLLDADGGEVLGRHAGDGRHVVASSAEQVEVLLAMDLSLNSKNEKLRECKVLTLYFSKGILNAWPIIKANEQKGINVNGSCSINSWARGRD